MVSFLLLSGSGWCLFPCGLLLPRLVPREEKWKKSNDKILFLKRNIDHEALRTYKKEAVKRNKIV
jgi:hypothetical protein